MEQNREPRNIHTNAVKGKSKEQRQVSGENIFFSTNGAGKIGHPYASN